MKYINELKEGDRVTEFYLCKQKTPAITKAGKAYDNVVLQDKKFLFTNFKNGIAA